MFAAATMNSSLGSTANVTLEQILVEISGGRTAEAPFVLRRNAAARSGFPDGSWESIGLHAATQSDSYTFAVPTSRDSTSAGSSSSTYIVTAHTSDPFIYFISNADSGHSVDNLAPNTPLGFVAQRVAPNLNLHWNPNGERDLSHYALYRGETADFPTTPTNLLVSTTDTTFVDSIGSPGVTLYYKLAAVDIHENESNNAVFILEPPTPIFLVGFDAAAVNRGIVITWRVAFLPKDIAFSVSRRESQEVTFVELTGAAIADDGLFIFRDDDVLSGREYVYRVEFIKDGERFTLFETNPIEAPKATSRLGQNHPNPFNPTTTIEYNVAVRGYVFIRVFDVSGRLVRTLVNKVQSPRLGGFQVEWDGKNMDGVTVSTGVYFYRMETGGFLQTRKMILLK